MDLQYCSHLDEEELSLIRQKISRLAHSILKRWCAPIDHDEIQSLADLAICEAQTHYRSEKGAAFTSFVYFYLKGILAKYLKDRKRICDREVFFEQYFESSKETKVHALQLDELQFKENPESLCYAKQLRGALVDALSALTERDRQVISMTDFLEIPLAQAARRLNYSRGHLHEIRRQARNKIIIALMKKGADPDDCPPGLVEAA